MVIVTDNDQKNKRYLPHELTWIRNYHRRNPSILPVFCVPVQTRRGRLHPVRAELPSVISTKFFPFEPLLPVRASA